jgi:putative ABC transport system substrate-binding protein
MRRREFIAGLVVTTAIGRAQAQQNAKVYRLTLVHASHTPSDLSETGSSEYRAFFQRLRQLGYVEGQNLVVERFSANGRTEQFAEVAAAAARANSDVMFVGGDRLATAVKASTDTVPMVAIVADPVALRLVSSLARPSGNITGVTADPGKDFWGKQIELLHEMVPTASRVGWLASPKLWEGSTAGVVLQEAAKRLKISLIGPPLAAPIQEAEYRRVFDAMAQAGAGALLVSGQPENTTNSRLIVELAAATRLPACYPYLEFAALGGLMAYGVDLPDMCRHAADQVNQILKGEKPGDIPFYQPTKFPLAINLKTAKALGITVPPTLLIAADEVIE